MTITRGSTQLLGNFIAAFRSVQSFRIAVGPANRTLGLCTVADAVHLMPRTPCRPKVP
jgi:hypothetical protein